MQLSFRAPAIDAIRSFRPETLLEPESDSIQLVGRQRRGERGGGRVAGVAVLFNASRTGRLRPDAKLVAELERRHDDEIERLLGIRPAALTADEAAYLIGFRDADEIRNRRAKAEKERDQRLRAKGIRAEG